MDSYLLNFYEMQNMSLEEFVKGYIKTAYRFDVKCIEKDIQFHFDNLRKAEKELKNFKSLKIKEVEKELELFNSQRKKDNEDNTKSFENWEKSCTDMLNKIKVWDAIGDVKDLKWGMIECLNREISDFSVNGKNINIFQYKVFEDVNQYRKQKIEHLEKDVFYHKNRIKELKDGKKKNKKFLKDYERSLKNLKKIR